MHCFIGEWFVYQRKGLESQSFDSVLAIPFTRFLILGLYVNFFESCLSYP